MTEDNWPKSVDELEKMFYGENKDGLNVDTKKLQAYHDQIRTKITSPDNEKFIERLFEPLGDIHKINETDKEKTSDFVVKDKQLLIEVTSLNSNESEAVKFSEKKIMKKIRKTLRHILEKENSEFSNFDIGGVVILDFTFNFYTELYDELKTCPEKITKLISNDIQFVMFLHNPTSFNETARKENSPVLCLRRNYEECLKSICYYDDFLICYID